MCQFFAANNRHSAEIIVHSDIDMDIHTEIGSGTITKNMKLFKQEFSSNIGNCGSITVGARWDPKGNLKMCISQ